MLGEVQIVQRWRTMTRLLLCAFALFLGVSAPLASAQCTESGSPNGTVDLAGGEECDDDNNTNSDGCSNTCEIESGYACAPPLTLDDIEVQNAVGGARPARWVTSGLSATQTVNTTEPTIGRLPGADGLAAIYTFDIRVNTAGDDDFIGFVLGYDSNEVTSATADYILIDWKQTDQTICGGLARAGMAVSRVTGASTTANGCDFWLHSGVVSEFARSPMAPAGIGNVGWSDNTTHRFVIRYSPTTIRLSVDGVEQLNIAPPPGESFPAGEIGLYGLSQDTVQYTVISPTAPSICNQPPEGDDQERWVVTGTPSVSFGVPSGFSDPNGDGLDSAAVRVTDFPADATTTDPGSGAAAGTIVIAPDDASIPQDYAAVYEFCDDDAVIPLCGEAEVLVRYNDPPSAPDSSESVFEGQMVTYPIAGFVADTSTNVVTPPGGTGGLDEGSIVVGSSASGPFATTVSTALGGTCRITGGEIVYTAPTGDAVLGMVDHCFVRVCETLPSAEPRACDVADFAFRIPDCACVVGDECLGEGVVNPANGCESCRRAVSSTSWTSADGCTPCTDDSMCPESTPACDGESGTCVPCTADRYCPDEAPVCDVEARSCEGCTSDAECGAIDPSLPICLDDGSCGECDLDAHCPDDEPVCDPESNECRGCGLDTECMSIDSDEPICAVDDGLCVECTDGAEHCPLAEPICDAASGTCGPCSSDAECEATDPAAPVCDEGTCVECTSNDHCSGTLVCDLETNRCEPCSSDSECTDPDAPFCEADSGLCVSCTEDSHCPGDSPVCDPEEYACVVCTMDVHCPAPNVCDPETNTCGPQCDSDADCIALDPEIPVCDGGTCVECLSDSDCGEGEVCDVEARACEPAPCSSDDECTGETFPVCDLDEGVCVGCNTSEDCEGDLVCDPSSGACAPSCTTDSDCPAETPACVESEGVCVECDEDRYCPEDAPICDVEARTCGECGSDEHCESPLPVCDTERAECVECNTSEDCEGALLCDPHSNRCVPCLVDDECEGDLTCEPALGMCVDGCVSDDDCGEPLPACDVGDGTCYECLDDSHCSDDEICYPGRFCAPQCTSDEMCPEDLRCDVEDGRCVECVSDDDCEGDFVCNDAGSCQPPCLTDDECLDPALPACSDENRCVECSESNVSACAEDEVCNVDDGICVSCIPGDDSSCEGNPSGTLCLDSGEEPRCGCVDDDDCGVGNSCDLEVGACVPAPESGGYAGGAWCSASTQGNGTFLALLLGALLLRRRRRN